MKNFERRMVFVTGSNGTLAKHLIWNLQRNHFETIEIHHDMEDIKKLVDKNDVDGAILVHCAFSRTEDERQLCQSIDFSKEIFTFAINHKFEKIINISSKSVYELQKLECLDENTPCLPNSNYSKAKVEVEKLLVSLSEKMKYKGLFVNVRLGSLISPDIGQRVINKLVKQAKEKSSISINNSQLSFQYLDVRDAAEAIMLLIKSSNRYGYLYCLGAQKEVTLKTIAECVVECGKEHNMKIELQIEKEEDNIPIHFMDSNRFIREFDWKERYSLFDTVSYIWDYSY